MTSVALSFAFFSVPLCLREIIPLRANHYLVESGFWDSRRLEYICLPLGVVSSKSREVHEYKRFDMIRGHDFGCFINRRW